MCIYIYIHIIYIHIIYIVLNHACQCIPYIKQMIKNQMIQPEDIALLAPQVGFVPPATLCACHHGLGVSQRRSGGAYGGLGLRGGAGLGNPLTNRDVKSSINDDSYWWLIVINGDSYRLVINSYWCNRYLWLWFIGDEWWLMVMNGD